MSKKRHTHTNQLDLIPGVEYRATDSHMVREHGMGPEGTKCLTCSFLAPQNNDHGKEWYKCQWDSHDWDIELFWQSCRKYESVK